MADAREIPMTDFGFQSEPVDARPVDLEADEFLAIFALGRYCDAAILNTSGPIESSSGDRPLSVSVWGQVAVSGSTGDTWAAIKAHPDDLRGSTRTFGAYDLLTNGTFACIGSLTLVTQTIAITNPQAAVGRLTMTTPDGVSTKAGSQSRLDVGPNSNIEAGSSCHVRTGDSSQVIVGRHANVTAGQDCTITADHNSVVAAGFGSTVTAPSGEHWKVEPGGLIPDMHYVLEPTRKTPGVDVDFGSGYINRTGGIGKFSTPSQMIDRTSLPTVCGQEMYQGRPYGNRMANRTDL